MGGSFRSKCVRSQNCKLFFFTLSNLLRLESGVALKDYRKIVLGLKRKVQLQAKVYTTLKQYIQDNTFFTSLDYDYFKSLYSSKFWVESCVFVAFWISYARAKAFLIRRFFEEQLIERSALFFSTARKWLEKRWPQFWLRGAWRFVVRQKDRFNGLVNVFRRRTVSYRTSGHEGPRTLRAISLIRE